MSEEHYLLAVREAARVLKNEWGNPPDWVIFSGTGQSDLLSGFKTHREIPYADLPHFPITTVSSHEGRIKIKEVHGLTVAIFQGRFHHYEGYSMLEVTFPIRVVQFLGVSQCLFLNAAGGIRSGMKPGDLVTISDHIFQIPDNPLRGMHLEIWGERFPDPKNAYARLLSSQLKLAIKEVQGYATSGIYLCLPGPNLETMAEVRFWQNNNVDLIGMSTIPEVLVAHQAGMKIVALSLVSNVMTGSPNESLTHLKDILEIGERSREKLNCVLEKFLQKVKPSQSVEPTLKPKDVIG